LRIVALDYGVARTGVAISDETGTLARPLSVVERVDTALGFTTLLELLAREAPGEIVVGLPVSLDGREHEQARRVREFVGRLTAAVSQPISLYDERFTSKLADQRGGSAGRDARAAATLLEDYLRSRDD